MWATPSGFHACTTRPGGVGFQRSPNHGRISASHQRRAKGCEQSARGLGLRYLSPPHRVDNVAWESSTPSRVASRYRSGSSSTASQIAGPPHSNAAACSASLSVRQDSGPSVAPASASKYASISPQTAAATRSCSPSSRDSKAPRKCSTGRSMPLGRIATHQQHPWCSQPA